MADLGVIVNANAPTGGVVAKQISGVVTDAAGAYADAIVSLVISDSFVRVWSSFTNPLDGTYSVALPISYDGVSLSVICRLLSGEETALILDNVIPQ